MAIDREYRLSEPPGRARDWIEPELGPKVPGYRTGGSPLTGRGGARKAVLWLPGDVLGFRPLPRMKSASSPSPAPRPFAPASTGAAGSRACVSRCAAILAYGLLPGRWEALVLLIPAGGFPARLAVDSRGPEAELLRLADRLFSS